MTDDPLEASRTRPLGLFGNPVEHSFSPLFMNHALRRLGLNHHYLAFTIGPGGLGAAVQAIRTLGFRGVNVTIPFKRAVFEHLESIDVTAARIGAVNCIVNDEGLLGGFNTDYLGFLKPLRDRGYSLKEKSVLLIGSGGAARAVIAGCVEEGVAEITVVNRTRENGLDLTRWCTRTLNYPSISFHGDAPSLAMETFSTFDLIVNTTPVGMYPRRGDSPLPEHLRFGNHQRVYDLIYNPWHTMLLKKAESDGASVLNGFEMLIIQGLYSLTLWFPERADEVMDLQEEILSYTGERVQKLENRP
jgi:shikimate dehydrogenase